ncbi:unnamed protein product [Trifolium pratense]|uniref:Uncharacterized protein n=1 Tax=Trifolium pratense TaxID=57577 RepID=A0ACB0JJ35_TRIPR|nr:unnamed protein product [Trifolium pratense]
MNTMSNFDHISLGLTLRVGSPQNRSINIDQVATTKIEPDDEYVYFHQRASNSTSVQVSSFSNSCNSIKRDRDHDFINSEQVHHDDVDENGNSNRKKLRLTKEQSAVLEDTFKDHSTLNTQKQELATKLNLRTRQVEVWFQNRRARTKLKQTEVDCEELKKCYETLTEENKMLEEELKELKSMKTTAEQFNYKPLPVAGLTVCPSCKKICPGRHGDNDPSHTTALLLSPKAQIQFYTNSKYTFTQSSATIAS